MIARFAGRRALPYTAAFAAVLVVLVLTQADSHDVPMGTVLYGVLYGSLNGLLAVGLVMLYRVTRSLNFAYGAMGGLPAGIAASLYLSHHTPWAVCVVLSLALGLLVGLGTGALVNWRFTNSPRLVLTVATIGLLQLLGGIAIYVPRWFHGPSLIAPFATGLTGWHHQINPVLFNGNDLVVVIVVPVVVAAVSWFLLRTDAGRAVRAIADNPDRARLAGVPARRLMLLVWAVAGGVAALAVTLQAPSAGVPLNVAAGPAILLAPLAAAIIAGMRSMPGAFLAGIGLGVVEAVVRLDVSKQSVEEPIFLGVILVALLLQHRSESRADAADDASFSSIGATRPLPAALRRLPVVRAARVAMVAVLAVVALSLPAMLSDGRLYQVTSGLIFGMAALSLVVLTGWSGTVSLGQMATVGIGAIVAGDLVAHLDLDLFQALMLAGAAGGVASLLLGLPALRVRGLYLAVTTMAFAVAANDFFFNPSNFASALPGEVVRPVLWKRFALSEQGDLYLLCLGVLALWVVLLAGLRRARPGRAIIAVRDNRVGAEAAAVPSVRTRLMAFTVAGVIAGMAGALDVVLLGGVTSQTFQVADSVAVLSMVVIGGTTSIGGSLASVALIQWIAIQFPTSQLLLTGVGVLVVLVVLPSGLAGVAERLRDYTLVFLARRRGWDTSVWADSDASADAAGAAPAVVTADSPRVPDGSSVLLRCSGVNAAYGSMQVLFGVDLTVHEGEIVALLGTNGAGKSSLLRSITGLLPAKSGTVRFAGRDITADQTEGIARSGLTMMPGGRGIFPSLTVAENLRIAGWLHRKDAAATSAGLAEVHELFPVLAERNHQLAGDMSGGQQQMLSLAMAFLTKPKLLCIDELSLGLAPSIVANLLDAVRRIHATGVTVVIVEQSVDVAVAIAGSATFLEKGQVRFVGSTKDLLAHDELLRAVFIGGTQGAAPKKTAKRAEKAVPRIKAEPALRAYGLQKAFGGIVAVNDVNLTVAEGEIVGLIGHNGAGKTTIFDLLCGFISADEGRIYLGEDDITRYPAWGRAAVGLGRSFQDARLFGSLTVAETLSVAYERHLASRDPVAAALRMPASKASEAALADGVDRLIEEFGLAAYRHRPTGSLSTGTRRIVELACVMAHEPRVMLLDEPSGGVAQRETEALAPLLLKLRDETGCAMLVVEHDMALISSICDRLVALELGAVIAEGTPAEVLSHPAVIASYLGTDTDSAVIKGAS
ncbi:MAG TPA: ATP-binding cassette domain-containing protein [Mycobacteriales bacterium]|nr:ATP-binding cassette domain-containing protein [Mycobacteriales bacterium]